LGTFNQLSGDFQSTIWGLSINYLGTFNQLFGDFQSTIWGLSINYLGTFNQLFGDFQSTIWGLSINTQLQIFLYLWGFAAFFFGPNYLHTLHNIQQQHRVVGERFFYKIHQGVKKSLFVVVAFIFNFNFAHELFCGGQKFIHPKITKRSKKTNWQGGTDG
jgi:hypothetical protein